MPEGDTIYVLGRYLRPHLRGKTLVDGYVQDRPEVDLRGRRIEDVTTHGKHLFMVLDDGARLRSHLGMDGDWHHYGLQERWKKPRIRTSIELRTKEAVFVCFDAKEVELIPAGSVRSRQLKTQLGPDLLATTCDLSVVVARVRDFLDPRQPMADVLLDQRVAAGIGNVYKSEVLFLEGVVPNSRLGNHGDATITRLYERARELLQRNVDGGPRVTRFESRREPRGFRNYGDNRVWVYGRTDLPCFRCDDAIASGFVGQSQRSTYWCPGCQAG